MKPRLLIVDDHGEIRRLVRLSFGEQDYEIHEAANGDAALELARRLRPAVVLLDVMMPGRLDGLAVCRQIKAAHYLADAYVLLLTARGQRSDIEAGLAAGADGYFVKPFSPLSLIERVEKLLSGRCGH